MTHKCTARCGARVVLSSQPSIRILPATQMHRSWGLESVDGSQETYRSRAASKRTCMLSTSRCCHRGNRRSYLHTCHRLTRKNTAQVATVQTRSRKPPAVALYRDTLPGSRLQLFARARHIWVDFSTSTPCRQALVSRLPVHRAPFLRCCLCDNRSLERTNERTLAFVDARALTYVRFLLRVEGYRRDVQDVFGAAEQ